MYFLKNEPKVYYLFEISPFFNKSQPFISPTANYDKVVVQIVLQSV